MANRSLSESSNFGADILPRWYPNVQGGGRRSSACVGLPPSPCWGKSPAAKTPDRRADRSVRRGKCRRSRRFDEGRSHSLRTLPCRPARQRRARVLGCPQPRRGSVDTARGELPTLALSLPGGWGVPNALVVAPGKRSPIQTRCWPVARCEASVYVREWPRRRLRLVRTQREQNPGVGRV
jgi:hypothetical protein